MKRSRYTLCIVILTAVSVSVSSEATPTLSLNKALTEAFARSPVLQARRAEVEQAEGRLRTAKIYPFNPEVTIGAARREGPIETNTDKGVKLAQEIQIGGQRRLGTAQASAELEAARAQLLREERLLAARVRAAFVEALRTRELLEVERANADLARSLAEVARKRFDSGAVAQMEVNLAQVQVGRAERDLRLAEGAHEVTKTVLAEVVGLDPSQPLELDGELDIPPPRPLPLVEFLAAAEENRADLESFRRSVEAAQARIELSRRQRVPNLELEAFYGREDGTDRLLGGALNIRIPVFNRNQGRIAEAQAAYRQTLAETESTELQVRQEVAASLARYRANRAASLNLQQLVLGTLQENLGLLQRSFEAGKTGWTDVLVFRREFVDVQRDYIETVTDTQLAGIELDLASGADPIAGLVEPGPAAHVGSRTSECERVAGRCGIPCLCRCERE
jgi:cobalt-zinc-cadmium efflux system outer membrane protein